MSASRVHCQVFVHTWNPESAAFIDASYGPHLRASKHQPVEQRSNRCRKQGGPDFGQLALRRLPFGARSCPRLPKASASLVQSSAAWPFALASHTGLVFDIGNNGRSQSLSVGRAALLMRAHERLRGRPYTLALALRADVALGSPFALASMDPRHVWLPAMCGSVVKRQSWLGPSSAPVPSQGLPWRLEAVGHSQGEEAGPLGTQPLLQVELAASRVADYFTTIDHPGAASGGGTTPHHALLVPTRARCGVVPPPEAAPGWSMVVK